PKLRVGASNNRFEQEADRAAISVASVGYSGGGLSLIPGPLLQRKCAKCEEEEERETNGEETTRPSSGDGLDEAVDDAAATPDPTQEAAPAAAPSGPSEQADQAEGPSAAAAAGSFIVEDDAADVG